MLVLVDVEKEETDDGDEDDDSDAVSDSRSCFDIDFFKTASSFEVISGFGSSRSQSIMVEVVSNMVPFSFLPF